MYDIWSTTIEHMRFMTYGKEMQKLYHMSYHMFTICYKSISVPYVVHMRIVIFALPIFALHPARAGNRKKLETKKNHIIYYV